MVKRKQYNKGLQMENLKLYTYDCGWEGALVCAAKSKEEAIEKIAISFL